MKIIIFLISLLYLTQEHAAKNEKCPKVDAITNIDYDKLNGLWYPIEEYPNPYDGRFKCNQDDYHFNKNGNALIYFTGIDLTTKENETISYSLEPKGDANTGSYFFYLTEMKKSTENSSSGSSDILATDYENYIVFWSCDEINSESNGMAWIEGRTRTISEDYIKKGRDVLDKFSIDTSLLKKVDQTNCD